MAMLNTIRIRITGLIIAAIWLIADIYTKNLALEHLSSQPVKIIDGFFNFRLAFNRGISFSMLGDIATKNLPHILGIMAFTVAAFLIYWLGTSRNKLFIFGVSSIIGGAVGNGIDRFRYGAVVDFLDFYYDKWHYPTFNIADTAIFIGVSCLLLDTFINNND